jgi:hypothetical protein
MRELYFDISSEESGGSLYRVTEGSSSMFIYNYNEYDDHTGDFRAGERSFLRFEDFWKYLTANPEWHYMHPLFVHVEQRDFIRSALQQVNWNIHPDVKWQASHQRQWKKVLTDPEDYYRKQQ